MGVDISGRNPVLRGTRPEIDWDNSTDEQRDAYFKARGKWHRENPGDYYQDSWWGWRPLASLIEAVNEEKGLGIDTSRFGSNDGAGPEDQETCSVLAEALTDKLAQLMLDNPDLRDDDDSIYIVLGSWVDENSSFIHSSIGNKITEGFEYGQMLTTPVITEDGTIAYSAHSTSLGRIRRFIFFLRECGGFQIW